MTMKANRIGAKKPIMLPVPGCCCAASPAFGAAPPGTASPPACARTSATVSQFHIALFGHSKDMTDPRQSLLATWTYLVPNGGPAPRIERAYPRVRRQVQQDAPHETP